MLTWIHFASKTRISIITSMRHVMTVVTRSALTLAFLLLLNPISAAETPWQVGLASTEITPREPMWMAGYGGRDQVAEGSLTPLYAKALWMSDSSNHSALLITADLVGIHRDQALRVRQRIAEAHGIELSSVVIACSHTHTGPVVGRNLAPLHYLHLEPAARVVIDRYEQQLDEALVQVAGDAVKAAFPASLSRGLGSCDFAVNRRTNPEAEVPSRRTDGTLAGPVDHRVPVLTIRDSSDKVRGIVFGYACHATVLSFYQWSGDYPGFAQAALENRFPEAIAMFWTGCGADQNPLPRRQVELARHYGDRLADAVESVVRTHAPIPVSGSLQTRGEEVPLELDAERDLEVWRQLAANETPSYERSRALYVLESVEATNSVADTYPYPIVTWHIGEIDWVFLGGEVVVDYALATRELETELALPAIWVTAYANDVMAYIPSRRVHGEGGYEGAGAMVYNGLPGPWTPTVETLILDSIRRRLTP